MNIEELQDLEDVTIADYYQLTGNNLDLVHGAKRLLSNWNEPEMDIVGLILDDVDEFMRFIMKQKKKSVRHTKVLLATLMAGIAWENGQFNLPKTADVFYLMSVAKKVLQHKEKFTFYFYSEDENLYAIEENGRIRFVA